MILLLIIARAKLFWHDSSAHHCQSQTVLARFFCSSLLEPNCSSMILPLIIARAKLFRHDSSAHHCQSQTVPT
jgi:hypothetical protein